MTPSDQALADAGGPLTLSPLLDRVRPLLAAGPHPVYLVGGAVRDGLLGHAGHDLDFAVAKGAITLAYKVGDALKWPVYRLDEERDIGRVVVRGSAATLDFARFRGDTLDADLRARDFTVNALALPVSAMTAADIIDPCGGVVDLAAGRLQVTSPHALTDDPVRALRAVRLAQQLAFSLTEETRTAVAAALPLLAEVSPERQRDEFNKVMMGARPGAAVSSLVELGLLTTLFPSLAPVAISPALGHVVALLDALAEPLVTAENRAALAAHMDRPVDGDVPGRLLLHLAALWHDAAPPAEAARLAAAALQKYRYSNEAKRHVGAVIRAQERPSQLVDALAAGDRTARRAVYHTFREVGAAGIDIALLALAHCRLSPQPPLATAATRLLTDYWHHQATRIAPPPLADGRQLMTWLNLPPGPKVGRLLAALQEAQVVGEVRTRAEAEGFVRRLVSG